MGNYNPSPLGVLIGTFSVRDQTLIPFCNDLTLHSILFDFELWLPNSPLRFCFSIRPTPSRKCLDIVEFKPSIYRLLTLYLWAMRDNITIHPLEPNILAGTFSTKDQTMIPFCNDPTLHSILFGFRIWLPTSPPQFCFSIRPTSSRRGLDNVEFKLFIYGLSLFCL